MITKEISKLCKKRKSIYNIKGSDNVNWIGDGSALYPLYKFNDLDKPACLALLDIPDGEEESIGYFDYLLHSIHILGDLQQSDRLLPNDGLTVVIHGESYKTYVIDNEILFINEKYFKPIKDIIKNENNVIRCFLRYDKEQKFVVVKSGFTVIAIICTSNVLSLKYIETMREYLRICEITLKSNSSNNDAFADINQQTFEDCEFTEGGGT